ncbi:hypothetical protein [Streptomyces sp. NPDC097619]|uniref:hypothetical protein n=1 Tax=Streptomyces sp. NPDC097619 TaxID=3157228 RepID=UPI003325A23B
MASGTRTRRWSRTALAALLAAGAVACQAAPAAEPVTGVVTDTAACPRVPLLPPTAVPTSPEVMRLADLLEPLTSGTYAAVYGTQIADHRAGRLALCVTDTARGEELLAEVARRHPEAPVARVSLYRARYSQRAMTEAMDRIDMRDGAYAHPIYQLAPAADASGVVAESTAAGVASAELRARLEAATGGVAVSLRKGPQQEVPIGPKAAG